MDSKISSKIKSHSWKFTTNDKNSVILIKNIEIEKSFFTYKKNEDEIIGYVIFNTEAIRLSKLNKIDKIIWEKTSADFIKSLKLQDMKDDKELKFEKSETEELKEIVMKQSEELTELKKLVMKQSKDLIKLNTKSNGQIVENSIDESSSIESGETPIRETSQNSTDETLKNKSSRNLPAALRKALWIKYIGADKMIGNCHVCKHDISFMDFQGGHVVSKYHDGKNELSNLRVVCHTCNQSMGKGNMDEYIKEYFNNSLE